MIITIDGPVCSGKSTIARSIAHHLGIYYLASSLLYRAMAYIFIKHGYTLETIAQPNAQDLHNYLNKQCLVYRYDASHNEQVFYDGNNLTPLLKTPLIDQASSLLSTNAQVRNFLTEFQRTLAQNHSIIVDGRDAGSVVFPQAMIKFFLTASLEVRAQRWLNDHIKKNNDYTFDQALREVEQRDDRDKNRAIAPLIIPQDAIIIDNSCLTVEQTINSMLDIINKI